MNVYDKFLGPCEVIEPFLKRCHDFGTFIKDCDFISVEKNLTNDIFKKQTFASMPKYFVCYVKIL